MLSGSSRAAVLTSRNLAGTLRNSASRSNNALRRHQQRSFSKTSIALQWFAAPKTTSPAAKPGTATPVRKATTTAAAASTTTPNPPTTTTAPAPSPASSTPSKPVPHNLTSGLLDPLPTPDPSASPTATQVDWSRSFHGLSDTPFGADAIAVLLEPLTPTDIEIKPDGILYLPEIKYRRILNRAFGPGAWGLAPRGETIVTAKSVTREYGLVVQGRLVSIARGEQQYFDPEGIPTATEGCKSNALMRCCKDLGIASELWDPVFIRQFMAEHSREVWAEHVTTKKKKRLIVRKDVKGLSYPWKETKA